ncbi:MAG TPA: D-alanyl-D-alanine carboxypeptidase, partial [Acidimicrobiales bacterium]|nr:D-alanyl-D-alanine carboxypeptidase [Acidimicrobiales bacterium]
MRRHLLPALLAVVSVVCGAIGLGVGPSDAVPGAQRQATDLAVPEAPVLSPRRVPGLLAQPIGTARLTQALQKIADSTPASACLLVTEGAHVLFERSADQPLMPASGMKLVTAAAALERLGPDERLRTEVVAVAAPTAGVIDGDLWLVGGGDPVLGTGPWAASFIRQPQLHTSLEELADRVVDAGVTEVRGRVVGDDSRYDRQRQV